MFRAEPGTAPDLPPLKESSLTLLFSERYKHVEAIPSKERLKLRLFKQ